MGIDFYIFQQINPVKAFFCFTNSLDIRIFNRVNQFAGNWPWLDNLAIFFAKYFEYFLIAILILLLFKNFKKYWLMVIKALGAATLARLIITNIIRWFWERPRPFTINEVNLLLQHEPTASFPSGHAAFYFAISTIVYFYNKKAGLLFFLASFLISFARVFSGIHWPSDILAGLIIGIFSGWLIQKIFRKYF